MIYYTLGVIMIALFGLSSAEVVLRFVFNYPLPWVSEVCRFLLIWLIFLGATEVTRRGGHLTVGISLNNFISEKARFWLRLFVNTCVSMALAVIGFYASKVAYYSSHIIAPASQIPMWCVWMAVPINFFLMMFFTMRESVRLCRGEKIANNNMMVKKQEK